jgi:hypothetical protein
MSTLWTNCGDLSYPQFLEICTGPPSVEGSKLPYYHEMLCNWATGFSPLFHWVILISPVNFQYLRDQIINYVPNYYEPSMHGKWDVGVGFDATFNEFTQSTIGCIFSHSFRGADEKVATDSTMANRGFATSALTNNRAYPHTISMAFKETNSSFTDSVLRPWSILTGYKGLVARPPAESIKATITVYELAKAMTDCEPSIVRKISTYYECAPTSVDATDLTYSTDQAQYKCDFSFNTYNIQAF